jgi:peptidyl-prolyl cis-trans isomerase SurA
MIKKEGEMFNARHILLKPKYTAADRNKAFRQLDSIVALVKADSITFEMAAMSNSEDLKSAIGGGVMVDPNTGATFFEKDQLKPADYSVIKDMKEGEISAPFESLDDEGRSGNIIYKVVKLDKIIPSHTANYKDDYVVIQGIADRKRQTEAIDKFVKEKQAVTYIKLDDLFKQCNFDREGWIK